VGPFFIKEKKQQKKIFKLTQFKRKYILLKNSPHPPIPDN